MKRLGCKAVPLSKEPMGLPVSEDVDTRGTASNIEDTNTLSHCIYLPSCLTASTYPPVLLHLSILLSHGFTAYICSPVSLHLSILRFHCTSYCLFPPRLSVIPSHEFHLSVTLSHCIYLLPSLTASTSIHWCFDCVAHAQRLRIFRKLKGNLTKSTSPRKS